MHSQPQNILILDSVESTNNYAMALVQEGSEDAGKPVFALEQTHGKGRRGKQWKSAPGENIILSVPMEMQWLPVSRQFELSVAVALGCYDLLAGNTHKNVFIKWPNDLFINDTKAGGILIENKIKGTLWQWAIIGIGLNINQVNFEEQDLKATSLKKATGKEYDVLQLVKELYGHLLKRADLLKEGNFEKMLQEYNDHLYARNQLVNLKKDSRVFQSRILHVLPTGSLVTEDILKRHFIFDEVEFGGIVTVTT